MLQDDRRPPLFPGWILGVGTKGWREKAAATSPTGTSIHILRMEQNSSQPACNVLFCLSDLPPSSGRLTSLRSRTTSFKHLLTTAAPGIPESPSSTSLLGIFGDQMAINLALCGAASCSAERKRCGKSSAVISPSWPCRFKLRSLGSRQDKSAWALPVAGVPVHHLFPSPLPLFKVVCPSQNSSKPLNY